MTEKKYTIGDYTNCRYNICEILEDDEVYCIVGTEYADKIIKVLEENKQLKSELKSLRKKYNDFSDMIEQQLKELDKRWIE